MGETPELAAERTLPPMTIRPAAAKPARQGDRILALAPEDCALARQLMDAGVALVIPTAGTMTQLFAARHPGLDLYALSDAPVHSAHDGAVTFAGWNHDGYGLLVTVQHPSVVITSPITAEVQLKTHYAHLSRIDVAPGAHLLAGQVLGEMGETGQTNGPHLHFEVRVDSVAVNPACFWPVSQSD